MGFLKILIKWGCFCFIMIEIGIDDAGRGPVIGPMILAGCAVRGEALDELKKIGAKDSKLLSQKKREEIEKKIINIADSYIVLKVYPDQITSLNEAGVRLNEVEGIEVANIINKLTEKGGRYKIIIDCPSVNLSAWKDYVTNKAGCLDGAELLVEHKADYNHISVACASILAKCEREREMDKLRAIYPDIGSGYPSDPKTKEFIKKNAIKLKDKNIFRKTWSTYKNAVEGIGFDK